MLEEHEKIDFIARDTDGTILLTITDAGLTPDPEERYEHLKLKLKTYVSFATGPQLLEEFPDAMEHEIRIVVLCKIPPTQRMLDTTAIARTDRKDEWIQIVMQYFPGADGADEAPATSAPAPSKKKRPAVFYVGLIIGGITILAALNGWLGAGKNPLPGLGVGIFFMIVGLVLASSRKN